MKKLLTILTSCSFGFLITASIILVNKNNGENNIISYNSKIKETNHEFADPNTKRVLTKIGYKHSGNEVRIKTIPTTVTQINAQLPQEITSLKNAFVGNRQQIKWGTPWDTKNITNMSGVFYGQIWVNDPSIKKWDVSKVTDMSDMFHGALGFNQDLSEWDVSKVVNMNGMFDGATEYNNENKHLRWENKLDSVKTMKKMFNNTPFKHDLKSWKMPNVVNNEGFGLDSSKQPEWKLPTPPSTSISIPRSDSPVETPKKPEVDTDSSSLKDKKEGIETESRSESSSSSESRQETPLSNDDPNSFTPPIESDLNNQIDSPNKDVDQSQSETLKGENETTQDTNNIKDNVNNHKNDDILYKIPPVKPNTIIKSNSPNIAVITGAVLGTFTILGIGVGAGYCYRKNLKNFYLNSANKTKNLYFKSKEKIKDKLSKIKSKK
ncbi:BspA family leucine-rich repeat surface protein [Mycoplasma mycoides]|uniref:BspA family leucine-rich repeat surface protein n=1 Tax=Mycoplasma mycoides TaxID=2102 RepID=UPI00223FA589|nr:BspA family leucine-rich repeat surface protein [Mycoplasma mycoides]QVK02655.1 BspA family leucine-rich repeat surface protein [Mycoplasma mycoides subsp. capri]QVK03470.1 BspA family leucine-rich repeat surface protein [Mycoplasma mycoides subsp. capri]